MVLQKELLANPVLVAANLLEDPDTVCSRETHDGQEAAKTCPQSKTRMQQEPL